MNQAELKALRLKSGRTLAECGAALGISAEGYRQKEQGRSPLSGVELATLCDLFGVSMLSAFPTYRPTAGEAALARHLARAA